MLNVGIMLMVSAAPTLIFGLIAGVFVDRYDRKTIMIVTVVIQAALVASIPFLITEGDSVFWLYVIVLLSSSVRQFFDPANDAVLPEVASDEELAAANSLMAIAQFGSTAIGFALAGLLAQFSVELVFFIDAGHVPVRRRADRAGAHPAKITSRRRRPSGRWCATWRSAPSSSCRRRSCAR